MRKPTLERQNLFTSLKAAAIELDRRRHLEVKYSNEWLNLTRQYARTMEELRKVYNITDAKLQRILSGDLDPQTEWERLNG